ncbi:MAG TPA: hypothetical protein VNU66_00250 [Mycobacteriales bacterium]|nr:hypothetical protein [Mycobacteriales bacterium]
MKKRASSLALTGVLGLAGLTAGVVVAPAVAVAQTSGTSTTDAVSERVTRIAEALSGLVSDGSLTQEQADEVATVLAERMPHPGAGHGHGHGRGHGGPGRHLDAAAEALGISRDELRTALRDGQSLAEVAEANGVERQALVDALVAAASEHLDEQVAEGDLTQEQADERKAELAERVEEMVDRAGPPARGDRPGRGGAADEPVEEGSTG